MSAPSFTRILTWAGANERKLGAALFAFGFLTDFLTFGLLPVGVVVYIFAGYLLLALSSAVGSYAFAQVHESDPLYKRIAHIAFPLVLQYAFGGLLSGLVVFYTAHSVVAASWPFLLALIAVYVGNEYFRMHKHLLVFQATLLFFTLYAVSVFALPLIVGTIGAWVFLLSTVLAVAIFAGYIALLFRINKARVAQERSLIQKVIASIVILVSTSYFAGLIPPIPLALAGAGIYQEFVKVPGGYRGRAEMPDPWWDLRTDVVEIRNGAPLYAYSAVAAPISFSSVVVHRWERYIPGEGWTTTSRIAFPIQGGREAGYRGYSVKDSVEEGKWRVSVETPEGLVIGRIRFDVAYSENPPALIETTL